jgi:heme/copper-type cytochrome/quinol oxidase subunit 3
VERNVIVLRPQQRRAQSAAADARMLAALALVAVEALLFVGLATAFLLTRAAAGAAWPPPGQPWFPLGETALNTAALLASGALVSRASRTWDSPDARIAPVLFAAILLGGFFLFFQGVVWLRLLGDGLRLTASHHGRFFCLIVAMHAAHTVGALALLGAVWLRLAPLRDDGAPRRERLRGSAFSAARIPWYFAVGLWPVLYVTLFR